MLDEIIDRSKKRGNNEQFISRITQVYYDDFPNSNDKVIWLHEGVIRDQGDPQTIMTEYEDFMKMD